ncbi:MAG: diguanylate cyclase [Dermatophilaceae bacterium]
MLVLLLASATATVVGVQGVVGQMERTADQLRVESITVAALRTEIVKNEQLGHQLLSAEPVDRSMFVQQQQKIMRLFDEAATVFPAHNGMRATIIQARQSWKKGLMTYGLFGDQVKALNGNHERDNVPFGASNDDTRALWDSLEISSHRAMDQGLAHGADLEVALIIALIVLFAFASAITVYFRRRMAKDLMRPVISMHEGVLKLQAGDYSHHIEVARLDELGDLAKAFNDMADHLNDSYRALTAQATHDSLTGLSNRAALRDRLTASFSTGSERRARRESLIFIDVDDFKDVNDTHGHEGGDALLLELATRLNACVRAPDLVARIGGDEFAIVVIDDDGGSSVAVEIAERILDAMREPFLIGADLLVVSVSMGVARLRTETEDASELLRQADFAMYTAKSNGKARYQLFDNAMYDDMLGR